MLMDHVGRYMYWFYTVPSWILIDLVAKHKSGKLRCLAIALITIYGHDGHLGHVTWFIIPAFSKKSGGT